MAQRWTLAEETFYRNQLYELYVVQNKTIGEIGKILDLNQSTVFKRIQRLGISPCPELKQGYLRKRTDIHIPTHRTAALAEFFGIMLGDGHVSHFQALVTLGTKELPYVEYVASLMSILFQTNVCTSVRSNGYRDVYIGSVELTSWLRQEGLVANKVLAQVDVPSWIFKKPEFMRSFLRGFFDTDGSIYKLRFGRQISLTNKSLPLLRSLREMLIKLEYKPSEVSAFRVYLTQRTDLARFFSEVKPANTKHLRRYKNLTRR